MVTASSLKGKDLDDCAEVRIQQMQNGNYDNHNNFKIKMLEKGIFLHSE